MMFDRKHGIGCIHLMIALALTLSAFGFTARAADPPADAGYEERQQWVLERFRGQSIPGHSKPGLIYALARLELAGGEDAEALEYISRNIPGDSNMFDCPPVARALHMFGEHFSEEQRQRIKDAVTGPVVTRILRDHGTENHAAMSVTSQYLLAQYFPDATWDIGRGERYTSRQMMEEAKEKILRRGRNFYRLCHTEFLSPTYIPVNVHPFLGLLDFAEDPQVRDAAEALVLYHLSLLALNTFDGHTMAPVNRRGRPHQRFAPDKINQIIPLTWLLWGQNEVNRANILGSGRKMAYFAMSDWRVPEPLNRIAHGAEVPYEIQGMVGPFGRWNVSDWIREPQKRLRYVWRDEAFAIGAIAADYFQPSGFNDQFHSFDIAWKSDNAYRSLEVMHPYWLSNGGEDHWQPTHSPFQQAGAYHNTAIVMYNIPDKDPWPDRGRDSWRANRDKHFDGLIKLGQTRFPTTVDEVVTTDDAYFFREGDVYVTIRVLKPGHTLELIQDQNPAAYPIVWNVIKSRHAQTGFVFEVGTADEHGSFEQFQQSVKVNSLNVDWESLEVHYTNSHGDKLRFRYDTDITEIPETWNQHCIWFAPELWINGQKRDTSNWPVADSPVASLRDGVLRVEQGGDSFTVDWSGELPRITKGQGTPAHPARGTDHR